MKIIFFYPYHYDVKNGSVARISLLSRLFTRLGLDVEVIDRSCLSRELSLALKILNFFNLERLIYFVFILGLCRKKKFIIISEVITAPTWHKSYFLVIHDVKFLHNKFSRNGRIARLAYLVFIYFAKNIITVSQFTKNELNKMSRSSQSPIIILQNAIPTALIHSSCDMLSDNVRYDFIYVSGFAKHKNHIRLVRSLPFGSRCCLIGQNLGCFDSIVALSKKRASEVTVDILTNINSDSELLRYISSAKVAIFPSLYEGFGVPILEYALLGKYIIASNIPPFNEFEGLIDAFFDPYSSRSMHSAMISALRNQHSYDRLKKRQRLLSSRYVEDNMTNVANEFLKEIFAKQ